MMKLRGSMILKIYDRCKYDPSSEKKEALELDGVEGFKVITGKEAEEIGAEMICNIGSADPYNEYLRICFENGEIATYRNSFVDLFEN